MFPNAQVQTAGQSAASKGGKTSLLFDFGTGDFVTLDGKLIKTKGLDAVKVWIEKILRTEKFKCKVYEFSDYGITLSDFLHSDYPIDFVKMEVEREIRDALLTHPDIRSVHAFAFARLARALACTFTVDTEFGQTGGEITL